MERKGRPLSSYVICTVSTLLEREGESESESISIIRIRDEGGKIVLGTSAAVPTRHQSCATQLNQVGVLAMRR